MPKDNILYELLGVRSDVEPVELRKRYHRLAILSHPDKNEEEEATKKFQQLSEAYAILSDPEQRQTYDRNGRSSVIGGSNQFDVDKAKSVFKNFKDELDDDEIDEDVHKIAQLLDQWSGPDIMKMSINERFQLDNSTDYFDRVDRFLEYGRLMSPQTVGPDEHRQKRANNGTTPCPPIITYPCLL
jgi:DnaJ-class molecular chaperone